MFAQAYGKDISPAGQQAACELDCLFRGFGASQVIGAIGRVLDGPFHRRGY
jgi:hypothetical protein